MVLSCGAEMGLRGPVCAESGLLKSAAMEGWCVWHRLVNYGTNNFTPNFQVKLQNILHIYSILGPCFFTSN
jgi:hypothetical protein